MARNVDYTHTSELIGWDAVLHTITDGDGDVLAESRIETDGDGTTRAENGDLTRLVLEWFPRPQHEYSEDPAYRKFVDSFFFYGDGTDGIDNNGEGRHAVSLDAGNRKKYGKLQLMFSPDVTVKRPASVFDQGASGLNLKPLDRSLLQYSTSDDAPPDVEQTSLLSQYDLLHMRDVMAADSADADDPINDTPKQKGVMGRKYLAERLGVSERTVRRMGRAQLVSAVRGEIRPSPVAHMKSRHWRTAAKDRKGYVCSSAPDFEDQMIEQFDAGFTATGLLEAPTCCEWPNPIAAAGWAEREGVNEDGTRWFTTGWWLRKKKGQEERDPDDCIRYVFAPSMPAPETNL